MTQTTIELVCMADGEVLVSAITLSALLRNVGEEMATWPGAGPDQGVLCAVREMLDDLADRIDADCIEVATEAAEASPSSG